VTARRDRRRDRATLQRVLAAEHAVVFGYGVAGARLTGSDQLRAERLRDDHRASRDSLGGLVTGLGGVPEPPAATYALPSPVVTPQDARVLATLLEERLAAVWADAVVDLDGDLRSVAVDGLRSAAVRAARWRAGSVPFPGLAERG